MIRTWYLPRQPEVVAMSVEVPAGRPAGLTIVESRLTRLSYASEIAQAMLRQQQANAVVGARQRIVEGAVGGAQGLHSGDEQ
jgi:hypothetical protein